MKKKSFLATNTKIEFSNLDVSIENSSNIYFIGV